MKLIIRWLITSISVGVAAWLIPGIRIEGTAGWWAVAIMAIALGLVNAVLRPILKLLSCGFILVTLGLFMLVVNGLTFWAGSWVAVNWFNVGFYVDGLWPAILGSIIVSIVSYLLSLVLQDKENQQTTIRA
ncbi:MAG: phage holin family protein [Anaerolineales bacterium]|jgi:putative membrane protein